MTNQEHLLFITERITGDLNNNKIRGIMAVWKFNENKASISFYFHGEATEEELEDASVACTEIIAHFPNGLLEEHFIRLDYPKPLPESKFWAYKREEGQKKGK